jgi:hypothetical protein
MLARHWKQAATRQTILAVIVTVAWAPAFAQEQSYDLKICSTTERSVIDNAGDTTVFSTVSRGMADSIKPGGPFDKTAYECRAVADASKAGFSYTSRCTFVDADGHKVIGTSTGTQEGWKWTFLGGTGKWEGIQGSGTGKAIGRYPRLSPAVSAMCGHSTGTFSLKK